MASEQMERVLIPERRAEVLSKDKEGIGKLSERLHCRIEVIDGNVVSISGEPVDEFSAKGVVTAFGRGFDIGTALKLLDDNYIFDSINLKEITRSKDRIGELKSRVIGSDGKTRSYIEEVSGVSMRVYGNTVSIIGTLEEVKIARAAIDTLLSGGTHKKAYRVMEAARRNTVFRG